MKNTVKLEAILRIAAIRRIAGIIALGAVIVFSFAACGGGDGGGGSGGSIPVKESTLTLTDIPAQYNGKYAYFYGYYAHPDGTPGKEFYGYESYESSNINILNLPQIKDGRVDLLLWEQYRGFAPSLYKGNDTAITVDFTHPPEITIYEQPTLDMGNPPSSHLRWVTFESITFSNGGAVISWNNRIGRPSDVYSFPPAFYGTWKNDDGYYINFTAKSLFIGVTQNDTVTYNLINVSGDEYTLIWEFYPITYGFASTVFTLTIRLVGGNLEIANSSHYRFDNGIYKKQE